jgi:glycosyltransferase involved in cell wall biosynthesis
MSDRLCVAVVTTFPPGRGSLNEYAWHFVNALRAKPEVREVVLLVDLLPDGAAYTPDIPDSADIAPLRFEPCWEFGAVGNAGRILRAVRRTRPDVVLFNLQFATFGSGKVSAAAGLLAPFLVRRSGVPTVVLLHNIMETVDLRSAGYAGNRLMAGLIRLMGNLVTRALLSADLVALTIPKYVEILRDRYAATNVLLAPHGAFDVPPPPTDALPDGPLQILTFGKFGTYKRVETLIEAFRMVQSADRPPLELVIAGSDSPNAPGYLAGIQAQTADLPGIRFTGYVAEEQVPLLFTSAAVTVFPYTSTTGSSGVLHQAGSYGKAAVLPRIGDFAEVIEEEGYTGEFFEPGDTGSLAAALARVIDDPDRRREIGRRNYLASCGIPIADVVDWYLLHIEQLQKDRPTGRP